MMLIYQRVQGPLNEVFYNWQFKVSITSKWQFKMSVSYKWQFTIIKIMSVFTYFTLKHKQQKQL